MLDTNNVLTGHFKEQRMRSWFAVLLVGAAGALAALPSAAQIALSKNDLVSSLQGIEAASQRLDVAALRRLVAQSMQDPARADRMNREPLSDELNKLAQITIAIQFDFNSSRIRPESYRSVGLMADALHHPYLLGYRFLIIGHTDGKGSREYNLKLSQQRADSIREALVNPLGVDPRRLESIGLGEEQLLRRNNPEAAENRRVQVVNIGR